MSGRTPGDKNGPSVEATLDDLPSVDTNPMLKPVATITLDEDPLPAPSATQLLEPVAEVPTDLKIRAPAAQVIGDSAVVVPRRRAPLKPDAFESAPSLAPARRDEVVPRGAPAPWQKASVWTPGLVALTVAFIAMVLVVIVVLVRG